MNVVHIGFRALIAVLLTGYVCVAFLTVAHLGIDGGTEERNGLCPLMPGVVICMMSPLQHIAAAQSLMTSYVQESGSWIVLLTILGLMYMLVPHLFRALHIPQKPRSRIRTHFEPRHSKTELQEIISQGIIHSKAF